jgi:hypothetical protein
VPDVRRYGEVAGMTIQDEFIARIHALEAELAKEQAKRAEVQSALARVLRERDDQRSRLLAALEHGTNEGVARVRAEAVAERDEQIIAWLLKKAHEYPWMSPGTTNVILHLADKISQGEVPE